MLERDGRTIRADEAVKPQVFVTRLAETRSQGLRKGWPYLAQRRPNRGRETADTDDAEHDRQADQPAGHLLDARLQFNQLLLPLLSFPPAST